MRYEGAIYRPPGERNSYLLQVTVGCSHNGCTFCSMYKGKRYRVRPLEEIFEDIELAAARYTDIRRIFLCDGDAVAMGTETLLAILARLYQAFPALERVNAYAGPRSLLNKTPAELERLYSGGLRRLYLGMETGCDRLLKSVCKGVDAAEMLAAGRRAVVAGFDLWVMVIIGLAGRGPASRDHALDTAALINQMAPRHLSALTYMPESGTRLGDAAARGEFQVLSTQEALEETQTLLEHLTVNPLHFTSDHASNYLPLKGGLPEDRARLLTMLGDALSGNQGTVPEERRGL